MLLVLFMQHMVPIDPLKLRSPAGGVGLQRR
jgi:hypothetical protein